MVLQFTGKDWYGYSGTLELKTYLPRLNNHFYLFFSFGGWRKRGGWRQCYFCTSLLLVLQHSGLEGGGRTSIKINQLRNVGSTETDILWRAVIVMCPVSCASHPLNSAMKYFIVQIVFLFLHEFYSWGLEASVYLYLKQFLH